MRFTPLLVASHQVFESVGFHLVVVDDIDAEVEQVFAVVRRVGDECPHREFEFVEHGFGDISSGVDQSVEEVYFLMVWRFSSVMSRWRVPLSLSWMSYMV